MSTPFRLPLATLAAGLLLAGCASKQASRPVASSGSTRSATVAPAAGNTSSRVAATAHHAAGHTSKNHPAEHLPDHTGIAACDDYLSSYLACHRAAGIYSPSQLPERYEAMRTSLLRDSLDPDIRPQLAARCNSLASTLRDALHGKACEPLPATASTAAH